MELIKATVSGPNLKPAGDGDPTSTDPRYQFDYNILCEGDSWMSIGSNPAKGHSNILQDLRFSKRCLLWNIASPGDTMKKMSNWCVNPDFLALISGKEEFPWKAIFLSAGGNDLIDAMKEIVVPSSATAGSNFTDYINVARLHALFWEMLTYLRRVENARDSSKNNRYTPIVIHCYDYAVPGDAPVKAWGLKLGGPWLYPAVNGKVPRKHWTSISEYLIDEMAKFFLRIKNEKLISNFHVIYQTLNVLDSPVWEKSKKAKDWDNEIHPSRAGYKKLAPVISKELDEIMFGTYSHFSK